MLVAFLAGALFAFIVLTYGRGQWYAQTAGRCCVTGCGRESQNAIMLVNKSPFALVRAWGVCPWCASSVKMTLHGECSDHVAPEIQLQ